VRHSLDARRPGDDPTSPIPGDDAFRFPLLTMRAALRLRADVPTALATPRDGLPDDVRAAVDEIAAPPFTVTPHGIRPGAVVDGDVRRHGPLLAASLVRHALWTVTETGRVDDVVHLAGLVVHTHGPRARSLVLDPALEVLGSHPNVRRRLTDALGATPVARRPT
jgi:hypothetical protein